MINVIENQSLLDIAIQEDGSVMAAFDWALKNGLSITDDLVPGQKLLIPNSVFRNADVANYFKGKKQMVATGFNNTIEDLTPDLGIGTMAIGTTFIVAP
jgi:capsid protein